MIQFILLCYVCIACLVIIVQVVEDDIGELDIVIAKGVFWFIFAIIYFVRGTYKAFTRIKW